MSLREPHCTRRETCAESRHHSSYYAELYRKHRLTGGHVIKLGPGNDQAARAALETWPGGLQVGGGITADNAKEWIDAGAEKVIVTSYLFPDGKFSLDRLKAMEKSLGRERMVVDVSCRKRGEGWVVAMNGWKTLTDMEVTQGTFPFPPAKPKCAGMLRYRKHRCDRATLLGDSHTCRRCRGAMSRY